MNLLTIIVLAVLLVAVVSFVAISFMKAGASKQKHSERQQMQKYNKRFRFYYDFVLTRQTFRRIYTQVASMAVYNMLENRMYSVKFFERALLSAGLLFVVGFIGLGDLVSGIVMMFFAVVMINTVVNKRVDNTNFKALKDMSKLILSIRECYTRVRNVPDAINDADVPSLLKRQISDIYLICTANDARMRLNDFYKTCPNRIMRTLATTCYIRTDAGDDDVGSGQSPFKVALGLVKDEVDMEVRRQIQQRIMFSTLDKLPFVPLIMYPPVKMFYESMIPATTSVFESGAGYVIKLVLVLACFISYYVLSSMNNASIARTDDRLQSIVKLMYRDKVVRFARTLVPKSFKKRHFLQLRLEGCISSKDLNYLYLEKFIFGIAAMVLSIVFTILITISARVSTYNSLTANIMSAELKYTAEEKRATLNFDHRVLAMDSLPDDNLLKNEFKKIFAKATDDDLNNQVERLKGKYNTYHALGFHWWYAFIFIVASLAGWCIPNMLLTLRVKMVRSEAEMDVLQMQTIIAILIDTPLDTLSVLYWLSKSSDIHKDILTVCYHEYVRFPEFALTKLKTKSSIPEFTSMIDKLLTTVYQVSLAEAFEDLVSERENTMKIREVVQLDQLKSKRNLASPIATAPMAVWMVAVFIVPIVIVAIRSAVDMMSKLEF